MLFVDYTNWFRSEKQRKNKSKGSEIPGSSEYAAAKNQVRKANLLNSSGNEATKSQEVDNTFKWPDTIAMARLPSKPFLDLEENKELNDKLQKSNWRNLKLLPTLQMQQNMIS